MTTFYLGSGNFVDMSGLPVKYQRQTYGSHDPISVKNDLGLSDLDDGDKGLFITVNSAVRWWPYLLVARDFVKNGHADTPAKSRMLFKRIRRNQGENRNYGPESDKSFRNYLSPYIGMYKNLQERNDKNSSELKKFLSKKKYDGNPKTFDYSNEWKSALIKAEGRPGRMFATLLKKFSFSDPISDSITEILKKLPSQYDPLLHKGAFCFAFLRCLYGEYNRTENKVETHPYAKKWSKLLLNIISNGRIDTSENLYDYIPYLKVAVEKPPFASITKKIKDHEKKYGDRRFILSDLRFSTFYNLYLRAIPSALEK